MGDRYIIFYLWKHLKWESVILKGSNVSVEAINDMKRDCDTWSSNVYPLKQLMTIFNCLTKRLELEYDVGDEK